MPQTADLREAAVAEAVLPQPAAVGAAAVAEVGVAAQSAAVGAVAARLRLGLPAVAAIAGKRRRARRQFAARGGRRRWPVARRPQLAGGGNWQHSRRHFRGPLVTFGFAAPYYYDYATPPITTRAAIRSASYGANTPRLGLRVIRPASKAPAGRSPGGPTPRRRSAQIKGSAIHSRAGRPLGTRLCEAITDF